MSFINDLNNKNFDKNELSHNYAIKSEKKRRKEEKKQKAEQQERDL